MVNAAPVPNSGPDRSAGLDRLFNELDDEEDQFEANAVPKFMVEKDDDAGKKLEVEFSPIGPEVHESAVELK